MSDEDIRSKIVPVSVIDKPGDYVLSLYDIDTDFYPNPRGIEEWESIEDMMNSLGMNDKGQQLQNIVCTIETLDDGRTIAATNAGYTRAEASKRNALRELMIKWNEENKLTKSHKDYIDPVCAGKTKAEAKKDYDKLVQVGGRWKEMYEAALKSFPLRVNIRAIHAKGKADYVDAKITGFEENFRRTDMSLKAVVDNIAWFASDKGGGMKGKDIAVKFKVSSGMISQWLSINSIEEIFREFAEHAKASDNQKELMEVCIKEFNRRSSLLTKDPCAILQSHARDFATFIKDYKKSKLKFAGALKIFCILTCVDDTNMQPRPTAQRVDLSIFKAQMEAVKSEASVAHSSAVGAAAGTTIKPMNLIEQAIRDKLTAAEVVSQAKEDDQFKEIASKLGITDEALTASVSAEIANKQELRESRKSDKEDNRDHDHDNIADDVFKQIAQNAAAAIEEGKKKLEEAKAGASADEDEDDDTDGIDSGVDLNDVTLDSIDKLNLSSIMNTDKEENEEVADEEDVNEEDVKKEATGEKSLKRLDVAEKVLTAKSVGSLIAKANGLLVLLDTINPVEGCQFVEFLCTLCDLVATYDAMGDNTKRAKFNESYLHYMDKTHQLLFSLVEYAKKNMNVNEFKELENMFPSFNKELLNGN